MTSPSRPLGLLASTVLTTALTAAAVAAPADAAGRDFRTIARTDHAKIEACKVPANHGDAWRIYGRIDNSATRGQSAEGEMTVLDQGSPTRREYRWNSVRPGQVSEVGSVLLPRKNGYYVGFGIRLEQSGSGKGVEASDLQRC